MVARECHRMRPVRRTSRWEVSPRIPTPECSHPAHASDRTRSSRRSAREGWERNDQKRPPRDPREAEPLCQELLRHTGMYSIRGGWVNYTVVYP